jgi:hypothetical protein
MDIDDIAHAHFSTINSYDKKQRTPKQNEDKRKKSKPEEQNGMPQH